MEGLQQQPTVNHQSVMPRACLSLLLALLVAACSSANANSSKNGSKIELGTQGDQLAFTQTEVEVQAGEQVWLTFINNAKALQHNWVLVKGGEQVAQQVSDAALTAGLANELQQVDQTVILAQSPLLESGERTEIAFTAPTEAGAYTYLCTFPGHFLVGMKGTLIVKP
ncbi:MAG: hypothetical protein KF832_10215 [Caldilineaceae bacterium]|nr:hypothetical protein [Caldilineaceae bacterium]